jgi:hypothetical protein
MHQQQQQSGAQAQQGSGNGGGLPPPLGGGYTPPAAYVQQYYSQQALAEELAKFWGQMQAEMEDHSEALADFKNQALPLARIKKVGGAAGERAGGCCPGCGACGRAAVPRLAARHCALPLPQLTSTPPLPQQCTHTHTLNTRTPCPLPCPFCLPPSPPPLPADHEVG